MCVFILFGRANLLSVIYSNTAILMVNKSLTVQLEKTNTQQLNYAELLFKKALDYNSQNTSAWRGLGTLSMIQGNIDDALNFWEKGALTAQDFFYVAEQYRSSKQYQQALKWYDIAVRMDPELVDAWYYMGLSYEAIEQWDAALAVYNVAKSATNNLVVGKSQILFRIGFYYEARIIPPQNQKAFDLYERAITLDDFPDAISKARVLVQEGIIFQKQEDLLASESKYKEALALYPDYFQALFRLGRLQWEKDKDIFSAKRLIGRAIEIQPDNIWGYKTMAEIYAENKEPLKAAYFYCYVLKIAPQDKDANWYIKHLNSDISCSNVLLLAEPKFE